jgi:hypothetical protein
MNFYRDISAFAAAAIGRGHRRCGRGPQDAHAVVRNENGVVAVVCDGCSSGARSEIGAGVGARFVAARCARLLADGTPLEHIPAIAHAALVDELARLAGELCMNDDERASVVDEHLLFTTLAIVATAERAIVFGVGDGVVSVDGVARVIDDGAAPDYAAYALFSSLRAPKLVVHHDGPWSSSLAIGSDGAAELIASSSTKLGDGSDLGGLAIFERDPRFVKNASLAHKRLHAWCAVNGPVDDCTIAVVRRGDT